MPLSPAAQNVALLSATDLFRGIGGEVGFHKVETHALLGVTFQAYKGFNDALAEDKIVAMRSAIAKVRGGGFVLPARMKVYTSASNTFMNVAFQRNLQGDQEAVVCLGGKLGSPAMLPIGIATIVSNMGQDVKKFITAVCVHELGHVLHEIAHPEWFWSQDANAAPNNRLAGQVSLYAGANKKEYVAEVFTGRLYDMRFGQDVLDEYAALHGP